MALNIVAHPYQYFGDPDVGRPIAGGNVYIGVVDLDPTIVANQKSVTLRQEDGTEVSVSQPISLSAGGYPSYQGSPVSILVDGDYSIAVLDSLGVQKFYSASSPAGFILTSDNSVTVVENVAALVASSPSAGNIYETKYYSDRANGGAGRYLIKTAAQAAADGDTIDETGAGFTLANGNVAIAQFDTLSYISISLWGSAFSAAVFQDAINAAAGRCLHFPDRGSDYSFADQVSLVSNLCIWMDKGAKLVYTQGSVEEGIVGTSKSNIIFVDFTMEGDGSASGFSNVKLTSCSDVWFKQADISKSSSMGIFLDTCTNVKTMECKLHANYFYGIEDVDGVDNVHLHNRYLNNGTTGAATSTGGRGLNIWRGTNIQAIGGTYKGSTEYGFRIYSEVADVSVSDGCKLIGGHFEDNSASDVVIYDESGVGTKIFNTQISNITIKRTTVPSLGTSCLIEGTDTYVDQVHIDHDGTQGAYTAFNILGAVGGKLTNSSCRNIQFALSFPTTNNFEVNGFEGLLVQRAITGLTTSGNKLKNFYFTQGGTVDEAVNTTNATGRTTLEDGTFDGFDAGIRFNNVATTVKRVTTLNSVTAGVRTTVGGSPVTTDMTVHYWEDNDFDSAAPTLLQTFNRKPNQRATFYLATAPTNLTWAVGDVAIVPSPTVDGNNMSLRERVCTVAGQPGTWVSQYISTVSPAT